MPSRLAACRDKLGADSGIGPFFIDILEGRPGNVHTQAYVPVAGEPLALIGCEGDGRGTLGLAGRSELRVNRAVEGCQEGHYQESGDA